MRKVKSLDMIELYVVVYVLAGVGYTYCKKRTTVVGIISGSFAVVP